MGQALSSVPQHVSLPEHVNLPQHDAMSARQHVAMSTRQHVGLPQHDGMSTRQHASLPEHVSFPKHATQLTKTTVPVVGTVSRRIDPEQTELEEDSIPRPATVCTFTYTNRAIAPNGLKSKGSKLQGGFGFMFAAADGQIH